MYAIGSYVSIKQDAPAGVRRFFCNKGTRGFKVVGYDVEHRTELYLYISGLATWGLPERISVKYVEPFKYR